MFTTMIKRLFAAMLVFGLVSLGWSVCGVGAAPLDKKANDPRSDKAPDSPSSKEGVVLPKGQAPGQVSASMNKDGKLVIKFHVAIIPPRPGGPIQRPVVGGGLGAGGGGGIAIGGGIGPVDGVGWR